MNRYLRKSQWTTLAAIAICTIRPALGNDYPTIDRVEYVRACALENPGPEQEMIYKCSCVIDAIARKLSYDDYVEASTAAKAFGIAGERGQVVRGSAAIKQAGDQFKALQAEAKQGCFIK